jgi:hypothetical protein
MQGLLDDFWQRPLTDVGLAGPDQGKGGKYLLLSRGLLGLCFQRSCFRWP